MVQSREMSKNLIKAATDVREKAYAPYSKFHVGAAIRTPSGAIYVGCNVENAAYPEGTCAEAGAIAAMCAAGEYEILEVAVIAGGNRPVPPCGGCRQKLSEFANGDVGVTMVAAEGGQDVTTVASLLPGAFSLAYLEAGTTVSDS
tara:strand:- start:41 stop:475 length:435 start_codon:yes stop_codon:yes gene_type:complete